MKQRAEIHRLTELWFSVHLMSTVTIFQWVTRASVWLRENRIVQRTVFVAHTGSAVSGDSFALPPTCIPISRNKITQIDVRGNQVWRDLYGET